jgi:hypothetical protein
MLKPQELGIQTVGTKPDTVQGIRVLENGKRDILLFRLNIAWLRMCGHNVDNDRELVFNYARLQKPIPVLGQLELRGPFSVFIASVVLLPGHVMDECSAKGLKGFSLEASHHAKRKTMGHHPVCVRYAVQMTFTIEERLLELKESFVDAEFFQYLAYLHNSRSFTCKAVLISALSFICWIFSQHRPAGLCPTLI